MYQWIARHIAEGMIASDFRLSSALGSGELDEDSPLLLIKQESPLLYVTAILNGSKTDLQAHKEFMEQYLEHLKKNLSDFFCTRIICLTIIVDNVSTEAVVAFVNQQELLPDESIYHVWWYATAQNKRIYTGTNQPDKILNIQNIVYQALENPEKREDISLRRLEKTVLDKTTPMAKTDNTYLTYTLFLINAFILGVMTLNGTSQQWIETFGVSAKGVFVDHEYYRLLTACFIHGGILHLVQNGIYLYFFGTRVELLFGKIKMLVLYLLSGLGGSIASVLFSGGLSVGASGALFGLMAAVLLFAYKRGRRSIGMNYTTLLLWAVVGLLIGFTETGVDNFAHIGGFLTGLLFSYLLLKMDKKNG